MGQDIGAIQEKHGAHEMRCDDCPVAMRVLQSTDSNIVSRWTPSRLLGIDRLIRPEKSNERKSECYNSENKRA